MGDTLYGVIDTVYSLALGSSLAQAATTGDGSVFVDDTADFDDTDGGTLQIGDDTYPYAGVDAATGEITLDGVTLAADADAGDRVDLYDTVNSVAAAELRCRVALPGTEAGDDFIDATLDDALALTLDEGMRGRGEGESVKLVQDAAGEWTAHGAKRRKPTLKADVDGPFIVAAQDPTSIDTIADGTGDYRSPMYDPSATVLAYGKQGEAFPRFRMYADNRSGWYWWNGSDDPAAATDSPDLWFNDDPDKLGLVLTSQQSSFFFLKNLAVVEVSPADGGTGDVFIRCDTTDAKVFVRAVSGQTQPLLDLRDTSGVPILSVDASTGEIELHSPGAGIVMASPDGTRYRATIANGGTWSISPA